MTSALRILIVGGYGMFGGRLVELLEGDTDLTLLIAGRSLARARDYCAARGAVAATLVPTVFDRMSEDAGQLAALQASIVVDASGPFQAYGADRYRLAERCIACGVHYLDLADGSDFVAGIAGLDSAARAAGVFVLSGVSSFPVLTGAVAQRLSADMATVQSIRAGIAPSPHARVGPNVIRAIASYAGQKTQVRRRGRSAIGRPFTESVRFVVAVPGRVPLERRRFSLVDVPDLRALAERWPEAADVWMGAAPVPAPLHWMLTAFAWLVRARLLPSLRPMAAAMHFVTNHVRWGEHRGGMFVEVCGLGANGAAVAREWHLLAEEDDGPLIPSMAVEAVIRKCLANRWPVAGARTAMSDVDLADYDSLFARRAIYTGIRERLPAHRTPLYRRILGESWERLASQIQHLHSVTSQSAFVGRCTVVRGRNPLAWLVAALIGFPRAGADQPIAVTLAVEGDGERWTRSSGGRAFSSLQRAGRGAAEWLVRERFGAVTVDMALVVQAGDLHIIVRRWALFGVPLPLSFGPRSKAFESVHDGNFKFDVEISHPLAGLIVRYCGVLTPAPQPRSP